MYAIKITQGQRHKKSIVSTFGASGSLCFVNVILMYIIFYTLS